MTATPDKQHPFVCTNCGAGFDVEPDPELGDCPRCKHAATVTARATIEAADTADLPEAFDPRAELAELADRMVAKADELRDRDGTAAELHAFDLRMYSQQIRTIGAKLATCFLIPLVLLACVPARHSVHRGAGGVEHHTIRCNYAGVPESGCLATAAEVCPEGFEVISRDQVGAFGVVTMLVRCSS